MIPSLLFYWGFTLIPTLLIEHLSRNGASNLFALIPIFCLFVIIKKDSKACESPLQNRPYKNFLHESLEPFYRGIIRYLKNILSTLNDEYPQSIQGHDLGT